MTTEVRQSAPSLVPARRLWLGTALGPVIWAVHLVVAYAIQSVSCHWGFFQTTIMNMNTLRFILLVITLVAAVGILAGGWVSYGNYQKLGEGRREERWAEDRPRFMAITGVLMSGLFLLSLLFTLLAILSLQPCARYWW